MCRFLLPPGDMKSDFLTRKSPFQAVVGFFLFSLLSVLSVLFVGRDSRLVTCIC